MRPRRGNQHEVVVGPASVMGVEKAGQSESTEGCRADIDRVQEVLGVCDVACADLSVEVMRFSVVQEPAACQEKRWLPAPMPPCEAPSNASGKASRAMTGQALF